MRSRTYPSDLTDFEWDIIKEMIPRAKKGGRKRTIDVRQIINAIFYATDNGVKWRSLPKEYPHWETVYGYFKRWTDDQTIEKIHRKLRKINRVIAGKNLMRRSVLSIVKQSEGRKKDIVEDSMQGKKQREENGIWSWTRWDSSLRHSSTLREFKIGMAHAIP